MSLKDKYNWLLKHRKDKTTNTEYQKVITEIYYQGWEDGANDERVAQAMRETFE